MSNESITRSGNIPLQINAQFRYINMAQKKSRNLIVSASMLSIYRKKLFASTIETNTGQTHSEEE